MSECHTGEMGTVRLRCEVCGHSTETSMAATEGSLMVACGGCERSIYWHRCETCGLGYVGAAQPNCAVCDGDEELSFH